MDNQNERDNQANLNPSNPPVRQAAVDNQANQRNPNNQEVRGGQNQPSAAQESTNASGNACGNACGN